MRAVLLLLPGMDGTGAMFQECARVLPHGLDVRMVSYPEDEYLTYEQLTEHVKTVIPTDAPYVILAESYSGPVASLLAGHPVGDLQAVIFVASFVSPPCGRIGRWLADILPAAFFRLRAPAWAVRWLLLDADATAELTSEVQNAIARVRPEVLIRRLRDALNVDASAALQQCTARIVCLFAGSDRLLGCRGVRGFLDVRPDIEAVQIPGPHLLLQCAPAATLAALRSVGVLP